MAVTQQHRVGTWSKALFGSKHLLELATVVAARTIVRPKEVQATTGLAPSSVHEALQTLVAVELLKRLERGPGDREQRYERQEHPFWDAANALAREAQQSGTEDGTGSERMGGHGDDT